MAVKERIKKQVRNLTVCCQNKSRPGGATVKVPWINLNGFWLSEAGFVQSSRVKVRVMQDCIVLTRESEEESQSYHTLQTVLRALKSNRA